jgi:hypothetical protein
VGVQVKTGLHLDASCPSTEALALQVLSLSLSLSLSVPWVIGHTAYKLWRFCRCSFAHHFSFRSLPIAALAQAAHAESLAELTTREIDALTARLATLKRQLGLVCAQ